MILDFIPSCCWFGGALVLAALALAYRDGQKAERAMLDWAKDKEDMERRK